MDASPLTRQFLRLPAIGNVLDVFKPVALLRPQVRALFVPVTAAA